MKIIPLETLLLERLNKKINEHCQVLEELNRDMEVCIHLWKLKSQLKYIKSTDIYKSQFIVYHQNHPIGYLQTSPFIEGYMQYPNSIALTYAILPSERRKGYATTLLEETSQYIFTKEIKQVILYILPKNQASYKTAKKAGFEECREDGCINHLYIKQKKRL